GRLRRGRVGQLRRVVAHDASLSLAFLGGSRRPHLRLMHGAQPTDLVAAQPGGGAAEAPFLVDPARAALLTHSGLSLRWPGSVPRCPVNPSGVAVAREKVRIRVTVFTLFTPAVFSQVRGGVGGVKTCRVV